MVWTQCSKVNINKWWFVFIDAESKFLCYWSTGCEIETFHPSQRIVWKGQFQPAAFKIMYFWDGFFSQNCRKDLIFCIQECSLQWHILRKTRLRRGLDQTTWKPPCNLEYLHREGDKSPMEATFIFVLHNIIFELYPVNLHKKINCIRSAIFPFNFFDTPQHRFTLQSHGWNVLKIFFFSLQLCFTSFTRFAEKSSSPLWLCKINFCVPHLFPNGILTIWAVSIDLC